jgi:hypothetical protein
MELQLFRITLKQNVEQLLTNELLRYKKGNFTPII